MRGFTLCRSLRAVISLAVVLLFLSVSATISPTLAGPRQATSILQVVPGSEARVSADVRRLGGRVVNNWHIVPALEVSGTPHLLTILAQLPDVRYASPNADVYQTAAPERGDPRGDVFRDALDVPNGDSRHPGQDTPPVGVALVDTGVSTVDDLGAHVPVRVAVDPSIGPGDVGDGYGHGTFLAGVIVGQGPGHNALEGVAPSADIISVKASNDAGVTNSADLLSAIQWVVDHRAQYNIRVMNLSLAAPVRDSYRIDPLDAAVEVAWLHGIAVVVAAGNCGNGQESISATGGQPYCPNVPTGQAETFAPANDPFVITVGATNDHGTPSIVDDTVAPWSSRGVTLDGTQRPDVLAPGSHIISVLPTGSVLATEASQAGPGAYLMGGTSVSAAEVSGVAALGFAAHPGWSPDQIKAALLDTARPVAGTTPGYPDARALVQYEGVPEPANQGLRLNALVEQATCRPDCQPLYYSGLTWDGLTWDGLTWDGLTWDSLTWHQTSTSWSAITWGGLQHEGLTWDGLTWDGLTWDGLTWDGLTWDAESWGAGPNL